MRVVTADFETYYDKEYSLTKLTTEEYVRDPRFEAIMVGLKVDGGPAYAVVGADIGPALQELHLEECAVVAHHAHFDGLILSHHYGIHPKAWLDTLSMARGVVDGALSLAALARWGGLPPKGDEVVHAMGKRLADFSRDDLLRYRKYCTNDVELTYQLMQKLRTSHTKQELQIIDMVIRMFTEPVLHLDKALLQELHDLITGTKVAALLTCGAAKANLMSNPKFAAELRKLGVAPPTKISPTTGKSTYAFAKNDPGMKVLMEHPDIRVQGLIAARVGVRSTLAETRAMRMMQMADRGAAPVYLQFSGAKRTGRFSGGDKMNWQNNARNKEVSEMSMLGGAIVTPDGLTALTEFCGTVVETPLGVYPVRQCHELGIRDAIVAPPGYVLVVVDSSNIEARVLAWLARQEDAVERFRRDEDPYCYMASRIFGRSINKKDHPEERRLGKIAVLGLGYGMGAVKFEETCFTQHITIKPAQAQLTVDVYRAAMHKVPALWRAAEDSFVHMMAGTRKWVVPDLIYTDRACFVLPSGRRIRYPALAMQTDRKWTYMSDRALAYLYGGKAVENIVQAVARDIVMEQTLKISKRGYRVVLSAHDEAVMCVPESEAQACLNFALATMRTPPAWALSLPLDAAGGYHKSYGGVDK